MKAPDTIIRKGQENKANSVFLENAWVMFLLLALIAAYAIATGPTDNNQAPIIKSINCTIEREYTTLTIVDLNNKVSMSHKGLSCTGEGEEIICHLK